MFPFGEVGIILKAEKIKSKILDRGQRAIMVGYGIQNGNKVYWMFKIDTKKVTLTRNIRWTGKSFGESIMNKKDDKSVSESEFEKSSDVERDEDSDDSEQTQKRRPRQKFIMR